MWDGTAFSGTKIALICKQEIVTYLRDQKEDIPFPGMWDLPGGGREDDENPTDCALREVEEEFGIRIPAERVTHLTGYISQTAGGLDTYFCIAAITPEEIGQIRFGDEGQGWALMHIDAFIGHEHAVPHLQQRLKALLGRC